MQNLSKPISDDRKFIAWSRACHPVWTGPYLSRFGGGGGSFRFCGVEGNAGGRDDAGLTLTGGLVLRLRFVLCAFAGGPSRAEF